MFPSFTAGNSLPAVEDDEGETDFPGLGNKNPELASKAKQMFDDLDFGDDDDEFKDSGEK